MLFGQTNAGKGATAPPGSSYGYTKESLSGIYAVLESQGAARRWELPMDRLHEESNQVDQLVIWSIDAMPPSDWEQVRNWVADGHTAMIGGYFADLYGGLTPSDSTQARSAAAHPVTNGIEAVAVGPDRFGLQDLDRLTLIQDDAGNPVLITWALGKGRFYWSADAAWLTNEKIAEAQNLDLALALLRPAPGKLVAFDEYHHGFQAASQWWQILRGPLQWFLVLLALATALLFWTYGVQFGAPRPTPPGPPRAAVEYVYSMSQLYRRAQARQVVLQSLYRSLTVSLGRLMGGARGHSHGEIAGRTAAQVGMEPAALQSLLDRLSPDQMIPPSEAELIKLARETEELQRRMQNAGFRDQRDA